MMLTDVTLSEFFSSYLYRTMTEGTAIIGACSGGIGCLLYLRKQSLVSDVVGHSAIAGVMAAFTISSLFLGVDGRSMLVITTGALISALMAVLLSDWISRATKLSQDAAMAICLALFYGLGIIGLHWITHSNLPNRGGIKDYIFGSAAALSDTDVKVILLISVVVFLIVTIVWKELKVFIFDPVLAAGMGFRASILSPLLLACATISIVIGVKAVGLILMVAFAVMPAAAARQWTKTLSQMVVLSAIFGAFSGVIGSYLAVKIGNVPTGPTIVIVLSLIFIVSMIAPPERSALRRSWHRQKLRKKLQQQIEVV